MNRNKLIAILAVALAVGCCIFAFVRDANADVDFELTVRFEELILDANGAVCAIAVTEEKSGEPLTVDTLTCRGPMTPSGKLSWHRLTPGQTLYISLDFDRSQLEADPPVIAADWS